METNANVNEFEKCENAKTVLERIAKGIDPLTGELISEDSFLQDPRIIRCFYFVTEIMDNVVNGTYSRGGNRPSDFIITPEQKSNVILTDGKLGVNEFSKCINACIDASVSKKITGVELNRKLKKLGILSQEGTEDGKTRTITNEKSREFGFEMEKRNFNGVEYEKVLINDTGKKYLLDNLEAIMGTAV